jgi:hypothetical protein
MHPAHEIGIDDFQASRSPDKKFYRTTPLKGLFVRVKDGFYHDGRFEDLNQVIAHYSRVLKLSLSDGEKAVPEVALEGGTFYGTAAQTGIVRRSTTQRTATVGAGPESGVPGISDPVHRIHCGPACRGC